MNKAVEMRTTYFLGRQDWGLVFKVVFLPFTTPLTFVEGGAWASFSGDVFSSSAGGGGGSPPWRLRLPLTGTADEDATACREDDDASEEEAGATVLLEFVSQTFKHVTGEMTGAAAAECEMEGGEGSGGGGGGGGGDLGMDDDNDEEDGKEVGGGEEPEEDSAGAAPSSL